MQEITAEEASTWEKRWVWTGIEWREVWIPPEDYKQNNPFEGTGKGPESDEIHPSNFIGENGRE